MDRLGIQAAILFIQLFILYPVIHRSITEIFRFIFVLTRSKDTAFGIIAVLCLPGTIVHELSHFLAATVLFLPVREIRIMPEWHHDQLRFGMVEYAQADVIRSVLVGIAPLFGAGLFFLFLYLFHLFPSGNVWITAGMGYVLFSVSANMFSSKQDLVDLIYVLPLLVLAGAGWYLVGPSVHLQLPAALLSRVAAVLQFVNFCITISLVIHLGVWLFIRSLWMLIKR